MSRCKIQETGRSGLPVLDRQKEPEIAGGQGREDLGKAFWAEQQAAQQEGFAGKGGTHADSICRRTAETVRKGNDL